MSQQMVTSTELCLVPSTVFTRTNDLRYDCVATTLNKKNYLLSSYRPVTPLLGWNLPSVLLEITRNINSFTVRDWSVVRMYQECLEFYWARLQQEYRSRCRDSDSEWSVLLKIDAELDISATLESIVLLQKNTTCSLSGVQKINDVTNMFAHWIGLLHTFRLHTAVVSTEWLLKPVCSTWRVPVGLVPALTLHEKKHSLFNGDEPWALFLYCGPAINSEIGEISGSRQRCALPRIETSACAFRHNLPRKQMEWTLAKETLEYFTLLKGKVQLKCRVHIFLGHERFFGKLRVK